MPAVNSACSKKCCYDHVLLTFRFFLCMKLDEPIEVCIVLANLDLFSESYNFHDILTVFKMCSLLDSQI